MPTYEYKCPACGHEFEEFQTMSADPISVCPACGKQPTRLISGGAGLIFKGSGFYITDYKRKDSGASKETDSGSKSEAKSETKSDSKPEIKSDSKPKSSAAS